MLQDTHTFFQWTFRQPLKTMKQGVGVCVYLYVSMGKSVSGLLRGIIGRDVNSDERERGRR